MLQYIVLWQYMISNLALKKLERLLLITLILGGFYYLYTIYASGAATVNKTNEYSLTDGLTGHWTFDGPDMVSNVADVSGNNYDGYLRNITSTTTAPGVIGQALTFDGTDDYVDTNTAYTNFLSTSLGTISAWVRPTGAADTATAGAYWDGQNAVASGGVFSGLGISRADISGEGDKIWAYNEDAFGVFDAVGTSYNVNEWTHIIWMHSGGNLSLYKDGVLVGSIASGNTVVGTGDLLIGETWEGTATYWLGDLDDIRTYNRALSADEITQLYNQGAAKFNKTPDNILTTGLVGHWTFDGPDMINTIADVSGNNNHGSPTVATTTTIGRIGQGYLNDGSNNEINVPHSASLDLNDTVSVAFWYKHDGSSGLYGGVLQKLIGSTAGYAITKKPTNEVYIRIDTSGGINQTIGDINSVDDGNWHHIVWVLDSGTRKGYRDGSIVVDNTYNHGTGLSATVDVRMASINLISSLDDVRVYNRALSADEITQLYNMGR